MNIGLKKLSSGPRVETIENFTYSYSNQPALTVVIPVRNICGPRIRNCIRSLELQRLKNFTTVIADYGSSVRRFNKLLKDLKDFNCIIYRYPTNEIWSLSVARNIGIRRARGKIVATLDADLILEQNVLSILVKLYEEIENPLVVSTVCNLRKKTVLDKIRLPRDYDKFRMLCKPRSGIGGLMSAPLEWWHKVRGFEERMKGWGVEDDDLRKRAKIDGRKICNIQSLELPKIKVYHQWHPKYSYPFEYGALWNANYRLFKDNVGIIIRNDENWGLWHEDKLCSERVE
jgi:glycosyltransferase involved in cell wall biosynthesis